MWLFPSIGGKEEEKSHQPLSRTVFWRWLTRNNRMIRVRIFNVFTGSSTSFLLLIATIGGREVVDGMSFLQELKEFEEANR